MSKKQEQPAEPAEFTPPAGGGRYQLINGVPEPVSEDDMANPESSGE